MFRRGGTSLWLAIFAAVLIGTGAYFFLGAMGSTVEVVPPRMVSDVSCCGRLGGGTKIVAAVV